MLHSNVPPLSLPVLFENKSYRRPLREECMHFELCSAVLAYSAITLFTALDLTLKGKPEWIDGHT